MSGARALICSFHDLAPHSRAACEQFLALADAAGVPRTVLLVVPRWHGGGAIDDDPAFVRWLRERRAAGHEICLHGWEHRMGRVGRDPVSFAIHRLYSAAEAEFHALDRAGAREKLDAGLAVMRRAGFAPRGFVAPVWLLSRAAREAARERGFAYTTTLGRILLLPAQASLCAPAITLSCRSAWRRVVSCGYAAAAAAATRACPLLRLAVHPADLAHARPRRVLAALLGRLAEDRTVLTYEELVRARLWRDRRRGKG